MWLIWFQKMLGWVLGALAVQKVVGFQIRQQIFAGAPALLASIIMALAVFFASPRLPAEYSDVTKLLMMIGLGGIVYPLVLFIVSPKTTYRRIRALILLFSGKKEQAIRTMVASTSPDAPPAADAPEVTHAAKP